MLEQSFIRECRAFFFVRRTKYRKNSRCPWGLERFGAWHRLGNGYYGEAWEHNDYPGRVLKISGVSGFGDDWQDAPYSSVARGEETPRDDVWQDYAEHCRDNPHPNLPRIEYFERVGRMAMAIMPRYESGCFSTSEVAAQFRQAMHDRALAKHWMLPLYAMARHGYTRVDLHDGNVMLDTESGEVIITDPFSSTGKDYGYGTRTYEETYPDTYSSTTSEGDTYADRFQRARSARRIPAQEPEGPGGCARHPA